MPNQSEDTFRSFKPCTKVSKHGLVFQCKGGTVKKIKHVKEHRRKLKNGKTTIINSFPVYPYLFVEDYISNTSTHTILPTIAEKTIIIPEKEEPIDDQITESYESDTSSLDMEVFADLDSLSYSPESAMQEEEEEEEPVILNMSDNELLNILDTLE